MPDQDLDRLADMRDAMDRMQQSVESTRSGLSASRGQDQASVITVRLDDDGKFVDVAVLQAWSDEYEPDELGAAVISAFAAATAARMQQWSAGIEEQDDLPAPQTRPLPPRSDELSTQLDELLRNEDVDATTATNGLLRSLQELEEAMDGAVNALESRADSRTAGQDGQRRVEALVDGGGGLVELTIDPDFALESHAFNISRVLTEAITNAMAASAARAAAELAPVGDLTELVARLNDPRAMAAVLKPDTYDH